MASLQRVIDAVTPSDTPDIAKINTTVGITMRRFIAAYPLHGGFRDNANLLLAVILPRDVVRDAAGFCGRMKWRSPNVIHPEAGHTRKRDRPARYFRDKSNF
jgi:hypothetical protein